MSQAPVMLDIEVMRMLGNSPEQIERGAHERIVLDLYRRREISISRAAALLGLDQLAFIRWSGALGVPFFEMTDEDWVEELRGIGDE